MKKKGLDISDWFYLGGLVVVGILKVAELVGDVFSSGGEPPKKPDKKSEPSGVRYSSAPNWENIRARSAANKAARRAREYKPVMRYPTVRVQRSKVFYPGQIDEQN